jgi:putative pyruvate formate lyase activating enzyme
MNLCTLCPRRCGINRKEHPGFCGMTDEIKIARAGLHLWEEPVISGERGSGTVFFSGCNLRCVFCQNFDISSGGNGKTVSVARLKEIYQELISQGAHNINLVTPSHYIEPILQSLETPLPVPVVWNSNGYDSVDSLRKLDGKVQIYLPDYKYAKKEPEKYKTKYKAVCYYKDGNYQYKKTGDYYARNTIVSVYYTTYKYALTEKGYVLLSDLQKLY